MTIAKDLGYKFFNSARDMSSEQRKKIKNVRFGGARVKRFTPHIYWDGRENKDSHIFMQIKYG